MKSSEKLRLRINNDLGLNYPPDAKFRRLYPGHWQRSAGAWLWCIESDGRSYREIGSIWTVAECLKALRIALYVGHGGMEVIPEQRKREMEG